MSQAARVASWQTEKLNFQMMTSVGGKEYACPKCWDWPQVYTCSRGACVKDPTGLGGFTKSDCGGAGKCSIYYCDPVDDQCKKNNSYTGPEEVYVGDPKCQQNCYPARLSKAHYDNAPLWETRADDMLDLKAVPMACGLRGGWKIKCEGQIGSPSAYGAIYKVQLPVTNSATLKPTGATSPTWIVGKCMIVAASNAKEQMLAEAASDLVASNTSPNFPLLIGVVSGCATPLRQTHRFAKRARALGIPLPQVKDVMYSELAQGDLIMWIKTARSSLEWKRVYYQVFKAIEYMQFYLNIIHNDMHGGNVLLLADGTALIHDFGLATIVGSGPNPAGRYSTMWRPADHFIDYGRACGMMYWAGTPEKSDGSGGYGGFAAPADVKAIFQQCIYNMDPRVNPTAYSSNTQAIRLCQLMRELWNPATSALYRPPRRLALGDDACSAACFQDGVLDPDTLQCSVNQSDHPGVQCCRSASYTGCACAGTDLCVVEPTEPPFTLQLVKSNGSGNLSVGVVFWANQTILVCMHPDAQPAKFKFVASQDDPDITYLQIIQSAIDSSHFPPAFNASTPANTPLYIRNGPPNYGGEQEGFTYVTSNLADATKWKVIPIDGSTGKFQLSTSTVYSPNYTITQYLRGTDDGNFMELNQSPQLASTWQAVIQ